MERLTLVTNRSVVQRWRDLYNSLSFQSLSLSDWDDLGRPGYANSAAGNCFGIPLWAWHVLFAFNARFTLSIFLVALSCQEFLGASAIVNSATLYIVCKNTHSDTTYFSSLVFTFTLHFILSISYFSFHTFYFILLCFWPI